MSKSPARWKSAQTQLNAAMPLSQYFLFVGGALVALLFVANWLPWAASNELNNPDLKLPVIRIRSELKGPEAVVIDTSKSTAALFATETTAVPQTASPANALTDEALPHPDAPTLADSDADKRNKTEGTQQPTSENFAQAQLAQGPILVDRRDRVHVEPHRAKFRKAFAQLVPRSSKRQRRSGALRPPRAASGTTWLQSREAGQVSQSLGTPPFS
jgi:hypothetical protein